MSEQDIEFAKSAFNSALPEVEYRAGSTQGPRPRNGRKAAAMAGTSVAAAAALFAVSSATTSAPAWSATPSSLNSADSAKIDQQCRAAKTDIIIVNGSGGAVQVGGGVQAGGGSVSVSSGDVSTGGSLSGSTVTGSAGTVDSTVTASGPTASIMSTVKVGDLPLLLIDSRGQSALAVYGDSTHHVICNIDPNMGTSLSPDSGAWPTPVAPALISSNSALAMGTVVAGDANGSKGTMQIVGTIDPSVRSMTVDVPSVGTVTATVKDGYYSLFIPNSMIPSTQSSWTATLTLNDGTVRTEALNQMVSVAGGAVSIAGSNP